MSPGSGSTGHWSQTPPARRASFHPCLSQMRTIRAQRSTPSHLFLGWSAEVIGIRPFQLAVCGLNVSQGRVINTTKYICKQQRPITSNGQTLKTGPFSYSCMKNVSLIDVIPLAGELSHDLHTLMSIRGWPYLLKHSPPVSLNMVE